MKKIFVAGTAVVMILVGVYLYYSKNTFVAVDTNQTNEVPAPIDEVKVVDTAKEPAQKTDSAKTGMKEYSDALVSFQYPNDWKMTDSVAYEMFLDPEDKGLDKDGMGKRKPEDDVKVFISPDARIDPEAMYPTLEEGHIMYLKVYLTSELPRDIQTQILTEKKSTDEFGGRYEVVKISGHDAILSNRELGSGIEASVIVKGKNYFFRFLTPDKDAVSEWELVKTILKSVKIK